MIRKRNKKAVEKHKKSQGTECLDNCQMIPDIIMMKANLSAGNGPNPPMPPPPQVCMVL